MAITFIVGGGGVHSASFPPSLVATELTEKASFYKQPVDIIHFHHEYDPLDF